MLPFHFGTKLPFKVFTKKRTILTAILEQTKDFRGKSYLELIVKTPMLTLGSKGKIFSLDEHLAFREFLSCIESCEQRESD